MKKDGFNPRINGEIQKNIFKMTPEEIDQQNRLLESELKKKKVGKSNQLTKKNQRNANNNLVNSNDNLKKNLSSFSEKMKIYSAYRTTEPDDRESNVSSSSKNLNIMLRDKTPQNKNNNLVNKSNYANSFISYSRDHTPVGNNRSNSNNKTMMSSFKNKLNSSSNTNNILETSNLEIKVGKTSKNLIPLKSHGHWHGQHQDDESVVKGIVSRLKLCQKIHLPNEKNYFISEKNIKLIESALTEKESDIDNLKMLLNLTKLDIDNFQTKYNELYKVIEDMNEEKNKILADYELLIQENKQIKENFDDYSFQYNKIIIFFKKIESLVGVLFKLSDSFNDSLLVEQNKNKNVIEISKKSKLYDYLSQIEKLVSNPEHEIRAFASLFMSNNADKKDFLKCEVNRNYLKMEKMNKHLKSKVYDYENLLRKLSYMYETKNLELTDIVKDMIQMKQRITDVNTVNDNLEKENEYLRVSYHNLYNELLMTQNSKSDNATELQNELENYKNIEESLRQSNRELLEKLKKIEKENSENSQTIKSLNEQVLNLQTQNNLSKFEFETALNSSLMKEKENFKSNLQEMQIIIANLNENLEAKEKIIEELKNRNMEHQRENSMKNESNLKFFKGRKNSDEDLESYLNKSDDNIVLNKNAVALEKKVLKYELEIKYLKDKLSELNDLGIENPIKSSQKKNSNKQIFNNTEDLLYHLVNQARLLESGA